MAIETIHRSSGRNDLMIVHILCGVALLSGLFITQNTLGLSIINQPVKAIGFLWAIEVPVLILAYSRFRASPQVCSVWWAIGRGLLSMPAGALVIAFGAIVFGAPLGLAYAGRTLHWSLLMSLFTVVPTATVFGISWPDWQRIFAHMKLLEGIDYALCFPAYGAVIGAWFGAWPMPLDWERPWQLLGGFDWRSGCICDYPAVNELLEIATTMPYKSGSCKSSAVQDGISHRGAVLAQSFLQQQGTILETLIRQPYKVIVDSKGPYQFLERCVCSKEAV